EHEPRLATNHAIQLLRPQSIAHAGRASILPDDGVADRLTRRAIPDDRRLALIGDADGGDVSRPHIRLRQHFRGDARLRRPDVARVVLYPARPGEDLRKLLLRDSDDRSLVIEQNRAGARRALV